MIPKNSTFVIFIYGLHRNPTYYTDPEKFEPERFLGKNANSRPTYSYLPFSGGFRGCIGKFITTIITEIQINLFQVKNMPCWKLDRFCLKF